MCCLQYWLYSNTNIASLCFRFQVHGLDTGKVVILRSEQCKSWSSQSLELRYDKVLRTFLISERQHR